MIGLSDGLTVPFALAAGISGAIQSTGIIVTAGLAEVAAGSIAMGLGGYLAAHSEVEHYDRERLREQKEIREKPELEMAEVEEALMAYGLTREAAAPMVAALRAQPESWVDFMMRFELGLERPVAGRAISSALTIGASYVVGGLFPLVPYMLVRRVSTGLVISIASTLAALFVFGYIKGRVAGVQAIKSAFQTAGIGSVAAAAAFLLARAIAPSS